MMNCGNCFHLEFYDGVGFCNYHEEDVMLDDLCEHFMNDEDTMYLLRYCHSIFNCGCDGCSVLKDNVNKIKLEYVNLL